MPRSTSPWIWGLILSLAVAVLVGGASFVLMTIGTHRFLSATAGKVLSDAERLRVLDESMLAPVQVITAGMLIGSAAALCVPIFLVLAIIQARGRRHDRA
jgi:hypothetical protein